MDANSLPTDGAVVSGAATFTQSGSKLNVNQSSNRTVIDWRSFDIGENAHVNFDQPNSGSIAVNRVNASTNASQINGQLTANGHVWVLNPNGVMFGKSARIDVAGLVASTGKIDTGRFMAGDTRLTVSSGNDGSVVNEGQITIREGGLAAFVAPAVRNNGIIQAKLGKVALAAGETFTLDLAGDQLVEIGLGLDGATAEQFGKILADGGRIEVSAKSAGGMIDSLINLAGVTSAASAEVKGGQIILGGDNIEISGTLDVSGVAGGGSIDIEGERITTTETADIRADSLDEGDGGTIVAYANIEGRYDGTFSAQGGPTRGNGGFVETSGKAVRISDGISVNTLAPEGKTGNWSIDPDELTVIETGGDGTSTIGADTIVTNLETTDVRIEANETININAEIDSSGQTNSSTLSLNDENDDGALVVNLNAAITMGVSQTLTGEASEVNVTDGASIQNGIDVSASGAIVNVAPGEYAETATYGGQTLGLVINKSVTLQGISSTGDVIADREDVEATVISGGESNWGTNFYVTGSDVTITGLEFQAVSANTDVESSDVTINKAFEVTADNFVMEHSIVAAADGYDYDGDTSTALYFGDGGADDLNNFTLNDNQLHGGITITNGAGDGDEPVDFTITNNEFLGTHFLRVRGAVDGVGWLNASAHAPTTVTGNDVSAVTSYVAEIWGNDAADQVDAGFISNLVENNTMGNYAYALAEDGTLSFSDYTEYGGTAPAFFLEKTIQGAVGTANSGDTVLVGAGTYEEAVTIAAANITLSGAQAGVDARDRSGDETVLIGSIKVEGAADDTVIDGFTIEEGAVVEGSKVGIYIKRDATDVTIQNNVFTRSGDVDGDGYRGILTVSNGNQTGLLIQNNSFSGWATGAYLNPGAIGAQILNNDFNGNFVGVSVDGPDGAIISGNSFTNNVFEGLGLGPGADILSAALTSNEFTGNTTHIGVYDDIKVDATSNIFDGTLASEMTTAQLLALEDKIDHGLDADYEGYVVTREGNVYVTQDSGSIQRAHDTIGAGSSLANQNIINVAPGNYTEGNAGVSMAGASGGQNFGLHLYHDNILVQGVDSAGNVITDATMTGATVTAEYQAGFGAQHFVYGDGVSVTGLTFKPVEGGDNKTFEVIGDNFTMRNSVIDNSGSISGVALYMSEFGDVEGSYKDVETFTIEDNIFMAGPETYYTI
ncbi:MAG: filamentous hemagglutinin N-terminal domain-containing protein, partial [Sneathiella sp.]|nr:filamentous hemagglutinin N-terminal domain-containing protein [Sneathiella sp.]